jgi:hypothetical protein
MSAAAPFISVVVPTMRIGGLDVLFSGLESQTYRDFELVLADGLKTRRPKLRETTFPKTHVEPWDNPFPVNAFCRFANTGLAHARGTVVLFVTDYTLLPPHALETHASFHAAPGVERKGLMCPHEYRGLPPLRPEFPRYANGDTERYANDCASGKLDLLGHSIFAQEIESGSLPLASLPVDSMAGADPKLHMTHGLIRPDFFHAKNESCRLRHVLEINGWDEDLDGTHCWQDSDLSDRLAQKCGLEWTLKPGCVADIINPRSVFPFARRVRPYETNYDVWQQKKAAGYPKPNAFDLGALRREAIGTCA